MTIQARRLVSEVREDGVLKLRLEQAPLPPLQPGELLVRVEACPLHPSDIGTMMGGGDLSRAERIGTGADARIRMPLFEAARAVMGPRIGKPTVAGNEGAGTVLAAGDAEGQALVGRKVAAFAGGMLADHRIMPRAIAIPLPEAASARDGAAITTNPMTALSMVEVMRREGATSLVHTAAASSLGRMLQRICAKDFIPLVNIVRRTEQAQMLRAEGAAHVLVSSDEGFQAALVTAFAETNATLAFDAVGGGTLAGTMLTSMERAQILRAGGYSLYGSGVRKRVYIYGRLDMSPTIVPPNTGMAWDLGGFLLFPFLDQLGDDARQRMVARVLAELTTTFATSYAGEVGLDGLLDLDVLNKANGKATGDKFLVLPGR